MLNRVWLWAAVGGVAMSAGACASTMQTTLNCTNLNANNADSLRIAAADTLQHKYANPGHSRRGGPPGGIVLGKAPHRAVLVYEDNSNTTFLGPKAEIAPETKSTKYKASELAKGKIIAEVYLEAAFVAHPAADSLRLPKETSYIAACVPTGPNGKQPANNTAITGFVIPKSAGEPLTPLKGRYYRTRVQPVGGRPWAFWSSSSKSGMCIACGHGWCQF